MKWYNYKKNRFLLLIIYWNRKLNLIWKINDNNEISKHSRRSFIEIGEGIVIFMHFSGDLMHSIAHQYYEIEHKQGPEHINLYRLEHCANNT